MEITIKIPGLSELAVALTAVAQSLDEQAETTASASEQVPVESKPAETARQDSSAIKLENVRAKLVDISQANPEKRQAVKELINSFGVKKLTDVDPTDYPSLLEKAEEL